MVETEVRASAATAVTVLAAPGHDIPAASPMVRYSMALAWRNSDAVAAFGAEAEAEETRAANSAEAELQGLLPFPRQAKETYSL